MDFKFTEKQEEFRKEVRSFLEDEIKKGLWKPTIDGWIMAYDPKFTKRVSAKGWIGLTWPKEYGGQGRKFVDRVILTEEMLRFGAPAACHWFADRQIGGSVLKHGTDDQKKFYLPQIVKGDMYVGLGMSEPEAGSDLASLKTRAIKKEDGFYHVDGGKTWTSGGKHMNYLYLLARTNPDVAKHKGLSEFVIPIDLPGVTTGLIKDITGGEHWNEVFFDNVKVDSKFLVGRENGGWGQVMEQLAFERSGMERLMANYPVFDGLIEYVKETKRNGKFLSEDPFVRQQLAQLKLEFETGRLFMYRVAIAMDEGRTPEWEAPLSKAYSTAFEQRLANVALEIMGPFGQLKPKAKYSKLEGHAYHSYLSSKGYSLQAGSTEVLKNILSQRKLGMPTE
jgi:alkylation response protein AidB-like acyl-CoA dehydrogenase